MPMRRFIPFFLAVTLLAACAAPAPLPTATATAPAPTVTSTVTPTPTATSSATPSATPYPTLERPLRIAVIGDYGEAGPDAAAVAALIDTWDVDFITTAGDNNYPHGLASTIDENVGQYYHSYIGNYQGEYGEGASINRFFPSLGNHDWRTLGALPYLNYFTLPGNERYYDVLWPPVHLFILDSDTHEPDGVGRTSAQAAWLETAMQASTAPWQLVVMHHAPYSSARHGSTEWMQWPFSEWGADLVLAAHDHVYERLEVAGLTYITNGLGGSPARYQFLFQLEESQVRYRDAHGALLIEATHDSLNIQFINIHGELIDSLEISSP